MVLLGLCFALTGIQTLCLLVVVWARRGTIPRDAAYQLALDFWGEAKYACLSAQLAGPVLDAMIHGRDVNTADTFYAALGAAMWYMVYRIIGDDDRWAKRRKKLAEKIKRLGSRLIVASAR